MDNTVRRTTRHQNNNITVFTTITIVVLERVQPSRPYCPSRPYYPYCPYLGVEDNVVQCAQFLSRGGHHGEEAARVVRVVGDDELQGSGDGGVEEEGRRDASQRVRWMVRMRAVEQ